jgi:short subunit dehydrogenase-like uncharacterized protein
MSRPLLVYGAYGYSGELISRHAVERGLRPILAGRDGARLAPLARELGCESRSFSLGDPAAVVRGIEGAGAVLHCAGPFVHTFRPVAEACLAAGVHYLDITGEGPVFQAARALGSAAERAGVMLLPGAGFDVVPTDCLALHLVRRLPGARTLVLAFQTRGGVSRGTARTALTFADLPAADPRRHTGSRTFDLGEGPASCVSIAWGDLVTAPRSTGVEDVAVYMAAPRRTSALLRLVPLLAPALRLPGVGPLASALLTRGRTGPDPAQRARGWALVYGEALDAGGQKVAARLRLPEGYTFTARSAVELARRALAGDFRPGWQTPASAHGPDLVLAIPGSSREEVV